MKGGLEQAEHRRLEQERERLRHDKQAARQAASSAASAPGGSGWAQDHAGEGISVISLFQAIHSIVQSVRKKTP